MTNLPPANTPAPKWWKRKMWVLPVWAWAIAAVVVIAAIGSASGGDGDTSQTAATTADTEAAIAKATGPATPPPTQAAGCEPVTEDDVAAVSAVLVPQRGVSVVRTGLFIANATAATDSDGVRYIVASIYDDTNYRVSSADTWAIVDGETLALSSSAVEHSTTADGRDVLTGPGQGLNSVLRDGLEGCAIEALRG